MSKYTPAYKIIENWDAKKYGMGSDRGTARISGQDIRMMVQKGADPEDVIDYYDSGWFKKQGYKTGGATQQAIDNLKAKLNKGGGGKGDKGKGGGGKAKGPSNEKGLSFFEGTKGMTPAEFDLYKEIKLRGIDSKNANKLQNIINSGKTEVAAISRDASIYGSLVSGFW
tara:strand:+ start:295 stop:801 length:507 start_codon:yes stop_codon:yes gene_type:complete